MDTKTDLRCRDDVTQWRPTRERGRPARMHSRSVSRRTPAMVHPANPAGRNGVNPAKAEPWRDCRSSRVGGEGLYCAKNTAEEAPTRGGAGVSPHALPQRTAQNACDGAPANPAGRNGVNPAKAEPWRDCRSSRVGGEGLDCAKNTAKEAPHPGARASRPHALPQRTAQNACDGAPDSPAGRNGVNPAKAEPWRDCRSSRVGEEGQAVPRQMRARRPRSRVDVPLRPLRSLHGTASRPCHFRCLKPCHFRCPLTRDLVAVKESHRDSKHNDGTPGGTVLPPQVCSPAAALPLEEQERWVEAPHPGARASRPHALPQRSAQNACDGAPDNPAGRNGVNPAKAEPWHNCPSSRVGEEGKAGPRQMRARRPRSGWASRSGRYAPSTGQRADPATFGAQTLQFSMPIDSVPGRVPLIRRIRGWVGAVPERPRVDTRGYTRALLRQLYKDGL